MPVEEVIGDLLSSEDWGASDSVAAKPWWKEDWGMLRSGAYCHV